MKQHKDYILPEIDLSHDEGDPRYLEHGPFTPIYRDGETEPYRYRRNGVAPGHYASYWQLCVVDSWAETVTRYETNPDDVYHAWWYVNTHPVFWEFSKNLYPDYPRNHVSRLEHEGSFRKGWPEITPHKVNPDTMRVEEDRSKNTLINWWYEFGPADLFCDGFKSHDYQLDGGAATYEQCVVEIAAKIHKYYGNDRMLVDSENYWTDRKIEMTETGETS